MDNAPISFLGNNEPLGKPTYDPNANKVDEELKLGIFNNPQNNILKANVNEISVFPRKNH